MRTSVLNKWEIYFQKALKNSQSQPHFAWRICLVDCFQQSFIFLLQNDVLSNQNFAKTDKSYFLFFSVFSLPSSTWPPFIQLSQPDCQPLLLNVTQAKAFKNLFEKIKTELDSEYIFKNEYAINLLRLIILLMAKAATDNQQHIQQLNKIV